MSSFNIFKCAGAFLICVLLPLSAVASKSKVTSDAELLAGIWIVDALRSDMAFSKNAGEGQPAGENVLPWRPSFALRMDGKMVTWLDHDGIFWTPSFPAEPNRITLTERRRDDAGILEALMYSLSGNFSPSGIPEFISQGNVPPSAQRERELEMVFVGVQQSFRPHEHPGYSEGLFVRFEMLPEGKMAVRLPHDGSGKGSNLREALNRASQNFRDRHQEIIHSWQNPILRGYSASELECSPEEAKQKQDKFLARWKVKHSQFMNQAIAESMAFATPLPTEPGPKRDRQKALREHALRPLVPHNESRTTKGRGTHRDMNGL